MSSIKINSNQSARQVQRALNGHSDRLGEIYARLSSGKRINKASDDAAGLAIASQLNVDARLANRARLNVSDGISALEMSLQATEALTSVVTRIRELAEQSANGSYSRVQREALNNEAQALAAEFDRIRESTEFNNRKLINGDSADLSIYAGIRGESAALQVGIDSINGGQPSTGSALVLDGADDSLLVAYDENHMWRGGDFTVELMAKIDPTDADNGFLISQALNGGGQYNYYLTYTTDGTLAFSTQGIDDTGAAAGKFVATNPGTIRFGEWQHIAMSYGSDRTIRLFVDGQKVGESVIADNFQFRAFGAEQNIDLVVGTVFPTAEGVSYPTQFLTKGSIDQVKISHNQKYIENFEPTYIQQNSDANTALLLNFESSSGVTHVDSSGHNVSVIAHNGASIGAGYQADGGNLGTFDLRFQSEALDALSFTASVLESLSSVKGDIAASIARLYTASESLSSLEINSRHAASRIVDADIAEESSALIRTKILQQTSSALLAQANLQPSLVLKLLGNS